MVDYYGRWTYEPNTSVEKKCDLDYVADYIVSSGYKPQTSIENLTVMTILHYDGALEDEVKRGYYAIDENPYTPMINVDDVAAFVEDSGGFNEFDYEA